MGLNAIKYVGQIKRHYEKIFRQNSIDDNAVQYVIAHALGRKTLQNIPFKTAVNNGTEKILNKLMTECLTGKPVQYVLGEWDFRRLQLNLRPPVFIPRPETEDLVSIVLANYSKTKFKNGSNYFLEVGCGSGAISLSILQENKELNCVAIDINENACKLTVENAEKHGLSKRIKVFHIPVSDVLSIPFERKYDFIVSNPPYIDEDDMKTLPYAVKNFEDHKALYGGVDGLTTTKQILHFAPQLLVSKGHVWLEVDSKHPAIIHSMKNPGLLYLKTFLDFYNKERFCELQAVR